MTTRNYPTIGTVQLWEARPPARASVTHFYHAPHACSDSVLSRAGESPNVTAARG